MRSSLLLLATFFAPLAWAQATPNPCATAAKRSYWPTQDWNVGAALPVTKAGAVADLESAFFTLTGKDEERKGLRTDGLLIIKGGEIIYEKYARGYDKTNPHISFSVAKSISSALIGIAEGAGALKLDDSICVHLPEYANNTEVCKIKVRNVVTFSTGLAWQEGYENSPYNESSVISMLFGVGHKDQLKFILETPFAGEPGKRWSYSTGDAQLASAVAKRALEKKIGAGAFWSTLFTRIGMSTAILEEDLKGTPQGGSNFFATPRDYAKFGYLFLNNGCWGANPSQDIVVSPAWVAQSTTISDEYEKYAKDTEDIPSGYMWWLNKPTSAIAGTRTAKPKPWPNAPDDTYVAIGHWGQYIVVIPSKDVVIVRTGDDRNASVSIDQLVKLSLAVVP